MPVVSAKTLAHQLVDTLPEDASLEDVIERLVVLHKVETGRAQVQHGEGLMTQEEVEAHFARRRAARQG